MNFAIRQLKTEDLQDGSGFLETLSHLSDISNLAIKARQEIFERASGNGIYFLVAVSEEEENKGQIVSTVKLIVEPKFFHGGLSAGHIEDVVTRQGFEGQGLSKALLTEAIKIARDSGCYKVILDCKKEFIPFYSKLGLTEHDICMRLDLID
ncbi:MAG: GNAT family N-acetyltransferase [Patescibacteria group bacterium]|jgi:glucosamine-phosphate N-acetyltransferase